MRVVYTEPLLFRDHSQRANLIEFWNAYAARLGKAEVLPDATWMTEKSAHNPMLLYASGRSPEGRAERWTNLPAVLGIYGRNHAFRALLGLGAEAQAIRARGRS